MEASINEPHVNDDPEAADDFFGDGDGDDVAGEPSVEEAAGQPAAEVSGDGSGEALPPVEEPAPSIPATATAAGRAAAAAAPAPAEPEPAKGETKKATIEREYMVFRELTLDEATLEKLLSHVKSGAEAPVVFLEVETVKARNDQHALKQVYVTHRETLGDKPRLAPVTVRSWKPKTVQPRQRVEEALEIL